MLKKYVKIVSLILIIILTFLIVGCSEEPDDGGDTPSEYVETNICPYCKKCKDPDCTECEEKCECEELEYNVSSHKMLEGKDTETDVYLYTTNKQGPKICIVGGIHGDELAGWNAALKLKDSLVNEYGFQGSVLLIPQANILADNAKHRYGVSGYDFSDLNRSFPKGRYSSAKISTIEISTALVNEIEAFDPDYIIDLHESRHSWNQMEEGVKTSLGDTLIASNNPRFINQIIRRYNNEYREESEIDFRREESNQLGSFNYYFTNTYPEKIVFTVETNRDEDRALLDTRIRQQLNILQAFFDLAWDRI